MQSVLGRSATVRLRLTARFAAPPPPHRAAWARPAPPYQVRGAKSETLKPPQPAPGVPRGTRFRGDRERVTCTLSLSSSGRRRCWAKALATHEPAADVAAVGDRGSATARYDCHRAALTEGNYTKSTADSDEFGQRSEDIPVIPKPAVMSPPQERPRFKALIGFDAVAVRGQHEPPLGIRPRGRLNRVRSVLHRRQRRKRRDWPGGVGAPSSREAGVWTRRSQASREFRPPGQ